MPPYLDDDILRDPPLEVHPEVRWWLAEGLHTDRTLEAEVDAAHRLGFGGMEFLAMDEPGIDRARYGWGSEEWFHSTEVVVDAMTRRRMAVSFTSGTNWANANLPTIDADHPAASKELDVVVERVAPGAQRTGSLGEPADDADRPGGTAPAGRIPGRMVELVAVIAAPVLEDLPNGSRLSAAAALDLTAHVRDGSLRWASPDDRTWEVHTFWMRGTGQIAEPSASQNFTVNYLDPDGSAAVIDYWSSVVLTPALRQQISANPRVQMYMDSLEIFTWGEGGMFWGRTVADEFLARRGYDVRPWLPFLTRIIPNFAAGTIYRNQPEEARRVDVEKVRHDYVRTLTDLYIENMLRPLRRFLHDNGMTLRAEISYGMPFELSRPGVEVDGIENESLEFGAQIDAYRMLSGVANLFGKQYSSETGATTRNHMLDHRFYDQIIATQFAAGISKTMLHGWASMAGAAETTEWPGHEGMYPMFSERFDLRQPASEFYPLWSKAMARYQYLLRCGRPRVDVGILRTDHFIDNLSGMNFVRDGVRVPDEVIYGTEGMRARDNRWWRDLGMQDAGWSYEFFDGSLLLHPDVAFDDGLVQPVGPSYQALVVYQEALDADVALMLLREAKQGLRVLIVDGVREMAELATRRETFHGRAASRTPGLDGRDSELATTIEALLAEPTVSRIDHARKTLAALRELGVVGRAEFAQRNTQVLTHLREDGASSVLYAYHFQYETAKPAEVEFLLEGHGRVDRVDPWTGSRHAGESEHRPDGRTALRTVLQPGESAVFIVDRDAESRSYRSSRRVVRPVVELNDWAIAVESWDAGGIETITEDRGKGYQTREAHPRTLVTRLEVPERTLLPWDEMVEVGPDVSGVGEYRTEFELTADTFDTADRLLLDLGSTAGALGSATLNGNAPRGFDTSHPVVDVTDAVKPGLNSLVVRVSSSLNNRLRARGYYDDLPDIAVPPVNGKPVPHRTECRPYGLLGPVRLLSESE